MIFARCGWTPFEGWQVKGRVRKVALRGKTAFEVAKCWSSRDTGRTSGQSGLLYNPNTAQRKYYDNQKENR